MQRKLKPLDLAAFQDAYQRSQAILRAGTFTDPRGRVIPLAVRRSSIPVARPAKPPAGVISTLVSLVSTGIYTVQYDDNDPFIYQAPSLAAVANFIRSQRTKALRVRVWAESGLQLIDTKFGDSYDLV